MPPQAPPAPRPGATPLVGTPPPRDWKAFATEEALRQGVDPELVHRVIERESKWNLRAISPKGAEGLMQLMPETARSLGVLDPFDGEQNIRAGVKYLKDQLKAHKGDRRLALAAYNAGPANVARFGGVPPFQETQAYVQALDQPPSVELAEDDVELVEDVELVDEGFDADVAQAAGQATRLTPGYSAPVDLLRSLPAVAGSMISILSKAGGLPGAAIGTVLGGMGAAAGELATAGVETLTSPWTGVPPPTPEAIKERALYAGAAGAGGELLGRPVGAVVNKALAPFKGSVDATGLEVQRMFPDALPNQVADSRALDAATAVAEASLAGGKRVSDRKALMGTQAQQEAFGIVHRYGGPISAEKAGDVFQEALEGNTAAFKQHAGKLYADVDRAAAGHKVSLQGLKDFAAEQLEKRAGIPGEVSGNRGLKMLQQVAKAGEDPAVDAQTKELAEALGVSPEELAKPAYASIRSQLGVTDQPMALDMSFQQAQTYRSDLLSFIRRAKNEKDDVARGVATQLLKRLDEAMDASAAANPALADVYKVANTFYRQGKQKYESALLRGLAEEYPEKVVETLVTPGATTPIREARAAIGPEGWKAVQARTAENLLNDALSKDGQTLAGDKLLGKLREMSPATLREVYPDDGAQALWTLGRVLERTQRKSNPYARTGILLAQGGVLVGAAQFSVDPTTAGAIILTPQLLARVLTSKTGAKWLTTGLEASPGTKLAAQAARKIAEQLGVSLTGVREPQAGSPPPRPPQVGQPPPTP